jgi:hypothetical protein
MEKAKLVRRHLSEKGQLILLGVFDAISAKIASLAGFQVIFITGYGLSATLLEPDFGLLTETEVVSTASMLTGIFWADHKPRVEFFVRSGLVSRAPTDAQLAAGFRATRTMGGVVERFRYYARNPRQLFPIAEKRQLMSISNREIVEKGYTSALGDTAAIRSTEPLFEQLLKWSCLFAPAHFALQCVFNPWTPVPTLGLNVPTKFQIAHILQTPHPFPLWDLQIVQADPGGLEDLERQLDITLAGVSLRARVNRTLAGRPGYFEYLKEVVPRIRRFDYPPVPEGLVPIGQNLVDFLNYAAEL